MALGAPADLLIRTVQAMSDEIRHTQIGCGIIQALSGNEFALGPIDIAGSLEGSESLEQIVRLCVREGIIGETLAALELCVSLDSIQLAPVRANIQSVAQDEAKHAELAYAFVSWVLSKWPDLWSVVEEEINAWQYHGDSSIEGIARWGIHSGAERAKIQQDGMQHLVLPLVANLHPSIKLNHN